MLIIRYVIHSYISCLERIDSSYSGPRCHDDIIKWKWFLHYWPFVKGIHQWLVDSLYKGPVILIKMCNSVTYKMSRIHRLILLWAKMAGVSWWHRGMEMISALLALCEQNQPMADFLHKGPVMLIKMCYWISYKMSRTHWLILFWAKMFVVTWWHHEMEMISPLLALCEGYPIATNGFPSQRANNVELWCFHWCSSEQTVGQTGGACDLRCHDTHVKPLKCHRWKQMCGVLLKCPLIVPLLYIFKPIQLWHMIIKGLKSHYSSVYLTACSG